MKKEELRKVLIDTVQKNIEQDGWTNLMRIGALLKEMNIDYKAMGYEKLVYVFKEYADTFNTRYAESKDGQFPPVFVRLKNSEEIKKYKYSKAKNIVSPKDALKNWGLLVKYDFKNPKPDSSTYRTEINKTFSELESKVLDGEKWYYGNKERDDNPILKSYLNYTFYRLQKEDEVALKFKREKKILVIDNYAAFNTGLVDNRYRPIYALFIQNEYISEKYQLLDFCTSAEGNHTGKELVRYFKPLPPRAHYFNKPAEMLYDITCGKPETNLKHIVKDNAARLPIDLLKENIPKGFTWKDTKGLFPEDRAIFFKQLGSAIFEDDRTCRKIESEIDRAIDLAMKRVEWNFKTAIPMYFPTENIMSLLLPLSILEDDRVDAALVVEKTKSGNYLGHTILTLEMAYSNARLVSRPDSDWLAVDKIDNSNEANDILEEE